VLAPVLISLLLILWGTLASQFERIQPSRLSNGHAWILNFAGVALALYVFMADSIAAAHRGLDAIRTALPEKFDWLLFCVALLLMSAPVAQMVRQLLTGTTATPEISEPAGNFDARAT